MLGSINLSYERVINDNTSFGIVVDKTYDQEYFNREYTIAPHYRIYFSKKRARGFFFETNFTLYSERTYMYNNGYYNGSAITKESEIGMGLGIALGGKFVTSNGFVLDIYAGIGRAMNRPVYIGDMFSAAGISIGKRF